MTTLQSTILSILEIDVFDIETELNVVIPPHIVRWVVRRDGTRLCDITNSIDESSLFDAICSFLPARKLSIASKIAEEQLDSRLVTVDYI